MNTFVETGCAVEFEGHKFEAGGAMFDDKHILAYVGAKVGDGMCVDKFGSTSRNYVTDWHGNKIGYCALRYKQNGFVGVALYSIHGQVGSRLFYGVGQGEGCVFKGKFITGELDRRVTANAEQVRLYKKAIAKAEWRAS